jgi:hypothetical protein
MQWRGRKGAYLSEQERREVAEYRDAPGPQESRSFWDSAVVFLMGEEAGKTYREQKIVRELGPLVGLRAQGALDQAVRRLTREGATVTGRTGNTVSFTYRAGPNVLILLFLLLLLVIPAIIYGIAASHDVHFTVTATPAPGGCRLLFGGEYGAGYNAFQRWLRTLPGPDTELTGEEESLPTATEASADIPTQIKKLAELRDSGFITGEEFEVKKRDLLKRM